jgi:hypothetical protein
VLFASASTALLSDDRSRARADVTQSSNTGASAGTAQQEGSLVEGDRIVETVGFEVGVELEGVAADPGRVQAHLASHHSRTLVREPCYHRPGRVRTGRSLSSPTAAAAAAPGAGGPPGAAGRVAAATGALAQSIGAHTGPVSTSPATPEPAALLATRCRP